MPAAMPCKTTMKWPPGNLPQCWKTQDKYTCFVEADESMRIRLEGVPHWYHEDHIAAKRNKFTESQKFGAQVYSDASSIKKIPDAKEAVEKEWETLEKIPAWQLTKVRNKKEVIVEARDGGQNSTFCVR